MNDMSDQDERAEEAVDAKETAAAAEPGLDHPDRATSTGDTVGSSRPADELSQKSVEDAARDPENDKPLDPATGVDDTRDPEGDGSDDE